ncbi:MAG TPA: hypothetical protein VIV54_10810 [Burkholderiales bacterium]
MKRAVVLCAVAVVAGCMAGTARFPEKPAAVAHAVPEGARIEMGVGHFNRAGKAFHYWDKEKEIPVPCSRCHGAEGVAQYVRDGTVTPKPHVKNGFACTNCHANMLTYERHKVAKVTFPSGVSVDSGNGDANLCMTGHQGIESPVSVNKQITGLPADTPDPKLNFVHVHYFPAGSMRYGGEAKVGYEYPDRSYAGFFKHVPGMDTCTACHEPHGGHLKAEKCTTCHQGGRPEGRAKELEAQKAELYKAIQTYAKAVGGVAIAFTPEAYPYWHADTNGNGKIDPEELNPKNKYPAYTPRLMQAVYNYTFLLRDPGAGYHNGRYANQIAYDSLESLAQSGKAGVSLQGRPRP